MDRMFVYPLNSYIEASAPNVFGDRVFMEIIRLSEVTKVGFDLVRSVSL